MQVAESLTLLVVQMSGAPLARLKLGPATTIAELTKALGHLADAGSSSLLIAYRNEILPMDQTVIGVGLYDGAVVTAIRCPELFIAAAYEDGNTKIWSAETGMCERMLEGKRGAVLSVAFSPNGLLLATGCMDGTVNIWSLLSGHLEHAFQGHHGPVSSIACSPDGAWLATGSCDRTGTIWSMQTGERLGVLPSHTGTVWSITFSPDGSLLATGSEAGSAKLWGEIFMEALRWQPLPALRSGAPPRQRELTLRGHRGAVLAVAFAPGGDLLATCSMDRTAKLWDATRGDCLQVLEGHCGCVCSLAFSPDGHQLVTGSIDGTARLWSLEGGGCQQVMEGHGLSLKVRSVSFSPGGSLLATASDDGHVRLWSVATGQCCGDLKGHLLPTGRRNAAVNAITFTTGPNHGVLKSVQPL